MIDYQKLMEETILQFDTQGQIYPTIIIDDKSGEKVIAVSESIHLSWEEAKRLLLEEISRHTMRNGCIIFQYNYKPYIIKYEGRLKYVAL